MAYSTTQRITLTLTFRSVIFWFFQPNQCPLFGLVAAEVNQHLGFVLGQIVNAGFANYLLIVSDRPGGALGLGNRQTRCGTLDPCSKAAPLVERA